MPTNLQICDCSPPQTVVRLPASSRPPSRLLSVGCHRTHAIYDEKSRLAYEAADTGLLSPELAAGIQRVKGARKVGVRVGNWLTADQSLRLLQAPEAETFRGRCDR